MSSNYTQTAGRSSRGGRRRGRRSGSSNGSYRPTSPAKPSKPAKKPTLWERFLAFFRGGSAAGAAKRARGAANAGKRAAEPAAKAKPPAERGTRPAIRKPEAVEVTTPRIYVGNLSFDATESDLFELFAGVGTVQSVEVVSNRQTQRSKGFAFVQMLTADEARRAVAELHDKEYMGRKLVVSGAKVQESRGTDRSQQPEQ